MNQYSLNLLEMFIHIIFTWKKKNNNNKTKKKKKYYSMCKDNVESVKETETELRTEIQ